jgi:Di-haem oxidoreductase, putative peroxidase
VLLWAAAAVFVMIPMEGRSTPQTRPGSTSEKIVVPKIWDAKQLATWATPVAGVNATTNYYSEEEYYAAPVDNLRTYPVYHPDFEPKGYRASLTKQGPQPMIDAAKLKTERDWLEAGRRVFEGLDFPVTRTNDPRIFKYLDDREAIKKDQAEVTKDGVILGMRYVVDRDGKLKVGLADCAGCHSRLMADRSVLLGAATSNFSRQGIGVLVEGFGRDLEARKITINESEYANYAAPWIKDDIHARFKTMKPEEIFEVDGFPTDGTFARFNGSPYYMTKILDLNGMKDRRYIDHTGTHVNRGPEDIARYAVLVSTADDGSIGAHKFLNDQQRKLTHRFSDEALYAIGKFVYSLEAPASPNKIDDVARRGQEVFKSEGCAMCHTPPLYTNNMLIPADGFTPPKDDPRTAQLHVMRGMRVGTDPSLALKTRKGTGYYKIPSLRGLWYRGLVEHSGSIASLEDWFDPRRLSADYVSSGWKGPGVKTRAVKGHEFGLELSSEDKRALIAFLRTL